MKCLLFLTALVGIAYCIDLDATLEKIQEVMRKKRDLYGATSYECYEESGECVMEFSQDGLVTFREENPCARSEEGCGVTYGERVKREQLCKRSEEELQLCRREESECQFLVKRSEEMDCQFVLKERAEREKRNTYLALKRRSEELCTVGGFNGRSKRFVTEECGRALEALQSIEFEDDSTKNELISLAKRDGSCPSGWSLYENKCYKYFAGPMSFLDAEENCEKATADGLSHLATLESLVVDKDADRTFFNNLIESTGNKDVLDDFFDNSDSDFDWDAVSSDYYDNWAWIGVREVDGTWKWVSEKRTEANWFEVKSALTDWKKGQPVGQSTDDDDEELLDGGKCVAYFHHKAANSTGKVGGWWNLPCKMEMPSLCECDTS